MTKQQQFTLILLIIRALQNKITVDRIYQSILTQPSFTDLVLIVHPFDFDWKHGTNIRIRLVDNQPITVILFGDSQNLPLWQVSYLHEWVAEFYTLYDLVQGFDTYEYQIEYLLAIYPKSL